MQRWQHNSQISLPLLACVLTAVAVWVFAQGRGPGPVLLLHGLQDPGSGASSQLPGVDRRAHPQRVRAGRATVKSWFPSPLTVLCWVSGMLWPSGAPAKSMPKYTENWPQTCSSLKRFVKLLITWPFFDIAFFFLSPKLVLKTELRRVFIHRPSSFLALC